MARMKISGGVTVDKEAAVINLGFDGEEPLAHISLDAASLEQFIRSLAPAREQMREIVVPSLDPYSRLDFVSAPAWHIPDTHNGPPGVLLALRHPGLGWVSFLLERERALQLADALRNQRQHLI